MQPPPSFSAVKAVPGINLFTGRFLLTDLLDSDLIQFGRIGVKGHFGKTVSGPWRTCHS